MRGRTRRKARHRGPGLRRRNPTPRRRAPERGVRRHFHELREGQRMAMTAAVKAELARLTVTKPCCRKAEMASLLRFAGALHLNGGHLLVEAELDAGAIARRLRKDLAEVYGHASEMSVVSAGGLRKGSRYVVRGTRGGDARARQTGLVDGHGRPVRGLPPQVVSGATCDA